METNTWRCKLYHTFTHDINDANGHGLASKAKSVVLLKTFLLLFFRRRLAHELFRREGGGRDKTRRSFFTILLYQYFFHFQGLEFGSGADYLSWQALRLKGLCWSLCWT